MRPILFDESLPALLDETRRQLGDEALDRVAVLRDATGCLTLLFDGELGDRKEHLARLAAQRLGRYARSDRVVADRADTGIAALLDENPRQWLPWNEHRVRYIDRRVVGADWLSGLAPEAAPPPRVVFSSLKGGVGRTTALCVAATDLARKGKNVLVVDLDLEAPGAGAMLLPENGAPELGALDFLVESVLVDPTPDMVRAMVASSVVPQQLGGRFDVVPAYGTATQPENYLGKLSRALLDTGPEGGRLPVHTKAARLLDALTGEHSYDVVLVDARAGLGELSAGPLLALGATVLLFGTAQRQTVEGYRILFAHLASLVKPETGSPWDRLCTVLAKAPPDDERHRWFVQEMHTLFQDYLYEEVEGTEGFNYDLNDRDGPHYPMPIAMNPHFADWDPARTPGALAQPFYEATFRAFLDALVSRIEARS